LFRPSPQHGAAMDGRNKSGHDDVATRWAKMRIADGRVVGNGGMRCGGVERVRVGLVGMEAGAYGNQGRATIWFGRWKRAPRRQPSKRSNRGSEHRHGGSVVAIGCRYLFGKLARFVPTPGQGAGGGRSIGFRNASSNASMSSTTTSQMRRVLVRKYSCTILSRMPAMARYGISGWTALNAGLMFLAASPMTAME
jgi:hypothetical protein